MRPVYMIAGGITKFAKARPEQDFRLMVKQAFDQALAQLKKPHEIHIYDGAGHAFANPSGMRYVPAAADLAWNRTMAFLARTLGSTGN